MAHQGFDESDGFVVVLDVGDGPARGEHFHGASIVYTQMIVVDPAQHPLAGHDPGDGE